MIRLFRYLMGYLTIKISGDYSEKILNIAASNGINIWNLFYKNQCIYGNISPNNFIKLFSIRHGTKCKIKIINKQGIYFKLRKYKHRLGLSFGIFVFFAVLIFLSNFVWLINVEGNHTIPASEIITSCKKIGIYEGVLKRKINNKYDAQRLQLVHDGIAWCSLNIEGSVLTINLSEVKQSDKKERQIPSNIKACIDGKIKKINTTSGNVVVKVGDFVTKGDLLVSGVLENNSSVHFVHSDGEIIAETKREFSAESSFSQIKKVKTGKKTTRHTISFFNIKIPLFLGGIKKPYNYDCDIKNLTLFDRKIPIKIATEKYYYTTNSKVQYDSKNLEEILHKDIINQVKKMKLISANEVYREVINTDKGILMKITYNCEENIALQDAIILNNEI